MASPSVLVVDDSEDILELVAVYLEKEGYSVTRAPTLAAAKAALAQRAFQAVVADIGLPDGDGVELVAVTRARSPAVRVVLVTGNATYAEAVRALEAGAHGFIAKPVERKSLVSAVARAVEAFRLEADNARLMRLLTEKVGSLQDMLHVSREVSASLDLPTVLSRSLTRMIDFFGVEAGAVLLPHADGGLAFATVAGKTGQEMIPLGMRLAPGQGIAGWAAVHRRPIVVNSVAKDPRFSHLVDEVTGGSTRSVLACPLLHKGELQGVLELVNKRSGRFRRADRMAAETLSFTVAAAIQHAKGAWELEKRVAQRTAELAKAQEQMVRAEKMASIGTIAAGVAHEINNPIGFINSNLQTLKSYVADLKPLVEELKAKAPPCPALQAHISKVDLDFMLPDIETLVRESEDGVKRVVKIVKDLKTFSHTSTGPAEATDLNVCIEAALNLSRNEVKYVAQVVTELAPLPRVMAWPSEVTQVLVNLIVNAGQAIAGLGTASAPKRGEGRIVVRSRVEGASVVLEVEDDGPGIPKEVLSRIFDPFYTTKEPGKGTGLGLSLSWEIVERHKGRLQVKSEPGKGATFTVRLPISTAEAAVRPAA